MGAFEFPTNIKQIGSIGDGIRIYIEDYACSYLQQYAEAGGFEERLAFLVGRNMVIDSQPVLFISGMVQGLHASMDKETLCFTDKSWQHAQDEIKRYFKGLDIVGWMQSQPGYGVYLNENYAGLHKKMFPGENQVMFVIDPAEKLNAFYQYDESQENLAESQGYFIYYDKNKGMHEYMLNNKIVKMKVRPLPVVPEAAGPVIKDKKENKTISIIGSKTAKTRLEQGKKPVRGQRRVVNLLVSLSAVLFIVCFIMGAGLIQNDGRITILESQLTQLNTAYRDLLVQIKDGNTSSVFASQDQTDEVAVVMSDTTPEEQDEAIVINADDNDALDNEAILANTQPENTEQQALTRLEPYTPTETAELADTTASADTTAVLDTTTESDTSAITDAEATAPLAEEPILVRQTENTPAPVSAAATNIPETYTVQQGDSLSYISTKYYGDKSRVEEIMALNGMSDPNLIYFGKVLKLPR